MVITERLPFSIRILLESAVRNCDEFEIKKQDVFNILNWNKMENQNVEVPFKPARVILQDFTYGKLKTYLSIACAWIIIIALRNILWTFMKGANIKASMFSFFRTMWWLQANVAKINKSHVIGEFLQWLTLQPWGMLWKGLVETLRKSTQNVLQILS